MNGSGPQSPRNGAEAWVVATRVVAFTIGVGVVFFGGAVLIQGTTAPPVQANLVSARDSLVDGQWAGIEAQSVGRQWGPKPRRSTDTARGGIRGKRPGPSGEVIVKRIPGSNAPTMAAGPLRQIRSMSTPKLMKRLAPSRRNTQAERTA